MSCKYYKKTCARCKKSDDYLVFDKPNLSTITLENYKNYVNFDLEVCPYCGYISTDVEQGYSNELESVINSEKYNESLTYSYLDDVSNKLNDNFLNSYPANLYECFAILKEHVKEYENAIKGYFKAVLLKETLIKRYTQQKREDFEDLTEIEIKLYDELNIRLKKSIKQNLFKILNIYKFIKGNIYANIMYIECLKKLNLEDKANKKLDEIKNNLPQDIINYINNLY